VFMRAAPPGRMRAPACVTFPQLPYGFAEESALPQPYFATKLHAVALYVSLLTLPLAALSQTTDEPIAEVDEELVVIGSRVPTPQYKLGNVVTTLDPPVIESLGFQYGADLFRFVPGVAVSRSGGFGGNTQLRVRGAEGNHILILIDGIDVSAAGTGEFDFSSLLTGDLQRIDVLRGPQSGLYGSNSLAGVISLQTLDPEEGFSLRTNLEAGANDVRQGSLSLSGGSERFKGRLSVLQRTSEFDVSVDDTFGPEKDKDENLTLSGKGSFIANDQLRFDLVGRFATRDTDTDGFDFNGGELQGLSIDDPSFSNTEDLTLGARATVNLLEDRLNGLLSVERTDSEIDGGSFGSESGRTRIALATTWQWRDLGRVGQRSTVFLEDETETFRNTVTFDPSQEPEQKRKLFGVGLEHRIDVGERLFLSGSLRHDNNDAFQDQTTWSTGISYRLPAAGTRLHASYGVGVTNPTFFEQFGFVPGSFEGNPDLVPEKSEGWDVGVEQTVLDGAMVLDLTYFDAELENEIQDVFITVINSEERSFREGVEFSLVYQPLPRTLVRGTYTYINSDDATGTEVRRPMHMASLMVDQRFLADRLAVGASVVYNGEQLDNDFRDFFVNNFTASRTPVDAYTLVNLNVRFEVINGLDVYARVENLFDEDYEELLSFATPGRSAYAGVRYRFAGGGY
jgi:vitamin B12 transporter